MSDLIVLGVDPGLARCGLAAIAGQRLLHRETIRTVPADGDEVHRADLIADRVRAAIAELPVEVGLVAIETQYIPELPRGRTDAEAAMRELQGKASSALWVAYVAGGLQQIARALSIPVVTVTPAEGKRALTGNHKADKAAMQRMAEAWFGEDMSEHEADACGHALAGQQKVAGRATGAQTRRQLRPEATAGLPERVRRCIPEAKR
jgi:Holliday junction resolvasome RuvABC endonuclease subunit